MSDLGTLITSQNSLDTDKAKKEEEGKGNARKFKENIRKSALKALYSSSYDFNIQIKALCGH